MLLVPHTVRFWGFYYITIQTQNDTDWGTMNGSVKTLLIPSLEIVLPISALTVCPPAQDLRAVMLCMLGLRFTL